MWIGLIETREESSAGVEVGGDLGWWLHRVGRLQPLEQACFEILEHRDLAHTLTSSELEGTPHLLHAFDELLAIKGHSSLWVEASHRSPVGSGGKNVEPTDRLCYSVAADSDSRTTPWGGRSYGSDM